MMTLLTCQLSRLVWIFLFLTAKYLPNINQNPDFVKKKNKIKENMLLLNCKHNDMCISKQSTIIFLHTKILCCNLASRQNTANS